MAVATGEGTLRWRAGRGSMDWLTYTTITRDELFDSIAGKF
jgi:hypothetical protein